MTLILFVEYYVELCGSNIYFDFQSDFHFKFVYKHFQCERINLGHFTLTNLWAFLIMNIQSTTTTITEKSDPSIIDFYIYIVFRD